MYKCTLSKVYEISVSLEGEENDYKGGEDDILPSASPDMENVEDETSEAEENQAEQTSEDDSEGDEGETGEQSEAEPAESEPTATPESYVSLIQETNEHLANIELMGGALFGVLGLFLGVYLIHDFFDSVKKI